ncbi:MAG TPA: MFS transporter [Planctomycetaceae bacterium]
MANAPAGRSGLTTVQWLVCVIASIGFAFDIYELLMLPLIVRPALMELGGIAPGTPEFGMWVGRLFYIPAFAGGLFGLLGGYLTDRLGRRRVLTFSILLYAVSAFLAGFSTNLWMLLVLRCTTFIGVCIEFVAAVAWLAELFTDPHRREKVLGYTQAFSSIGGLMVAVAFGLAVDFNTRLPAIALPDWLSSLLGGGVIKDPHAAWRYTLMSGLIPAIPLIVIRPFLPESPAWTAKKAAGTLRRPSFGELFGPGLAKTTVVTTLMFACSYGAAFGAIQMIPQIVPGLPEVRSAAAEAAEAAPEPARVKAQKDVENAAASNYTKVQEIGGLAGRFLLALLVVRIVSRRALLRVFQVPGLILMPLIFAYAAIDNPVLFTFDWGVKWNWYVVKFGVWQVTLLHLGIFLAGLFTVAQFSFWGNYLPRVYPLHLRGTGESFAANIGGRMIGTCFAWVTSTLAVQPFVPGDTPPHKVAYAAAGVALFVYLAGVVLSFFLPEPGRDIDEEETIGHGEASPLIPATVEPKRP